MKKMLILFFVLSVLTGLGLKYLDSKNKEANNSKPTMKMVDFQ